MLTIAQQQESLRDLLRGRPVNTQGDPWLAEVATSKGLRIMQATISWWLRFQIEFQCRYTSRLLKRRNCFEHCIDACFGESAAPPSIEELSMAFLRSLENHEDPLTRAVASFELACIARPPRNDEPAIIEWDRNPAEVIVALDACTELPPEEPGCRYVLRIDGDLRGGMSCVREEQAVEACHGG